MIPEIKFAIMKLLIHSREERLTCFDCKMSLYLNFDNTLMYVAFDWVSSKAAVDLLEVGF